MFTKRAQAWLRETHSTQFELLRHFLSQQFVHELVSSDQVRRFVIALLAVLGCVGPLIVRIYVAKYAYLQGLPDLFQSAVHADRLFFISLSMIVVGLVTAIQWQSLFPDRRDYLTLKPLPLRLYEVFVARSLALLVMVVIVIVDVNLATSVLFPLLASGKPPFPQFGVRYVVAHAAVTSGSGLFVFFAMVAFQGLLLNLLPPRTFARWSVGIQVFLVTAFVTTGPYVLDIPNWHEMIQAQPHWLWFFPPAWFLGLYERLLGTHDLFFLRQSDVALRALGASFIVTLGTYFLSYRRHGIRVLEQPLAKARNASRTPSLVERWLEHLIKSSHERAAFGFTIQTLRRSRYHKSLVGFAIGIGLVLALQATGPIVIAQLRSAAPWSYLQIQSVLAVPLVLGGVMVSGLCYVFQLPAEVRANWIFRMAEGRRRRELLSSVERALVFLAVIPALLVALPIATLALGGAVAIAHIVLAAVLLLLLVELRLHDWHKIPFACSYMPGRRNVWLTVGAYLLLFAVLIPAITLVEVILLRPFVLIAAATTLGVYYLGLRSARQNQWESVPLLFDESDEPLIRTIHLGQE